MKSLGLRRHALMLAVGMGLATAAVPAGAQDFELAAAPAPVSGSDTLDIKINPDGTAQEWRTRRIKALTQTGGKAVAKQVLAFQATLHNVRVLEAYTEKADGRRIEVARAGIVVRDAASNDVDAHDSRIMTIIFPDVAIGDTVVFTALKETKRPPLARHYWQVIGAEAFVADTVRIVAPKDLWLAVAAYGEGYAHNIVFDESTATHTLLRPAMPTADPRPNEPGATAPAESEIPHIVISTFKDYWMLGRSAWAASKSRIETTPEIAALAAEITAGIDERRAQAEAIDQWVKRNIRYVAIEIGVGGIVPHHAALVLKNRYGDCKDHATLMAALLAAKGIASELVLIRAGNVFALPEVAHTGAFNHMIIYLPEFRLYDDPTVATAGFGVLSAGTYDHPVVRISAQGVWVARTPAMRVADHVSANRTRINVAADGATTGETTETTTGIFATHARNRALDILDNKGLDDGAVEALRTNGTPGDGLFEIDQAASLADPFVVKGHFQIGKINIVPKATYMVPVGLALMPRAGSAFLGTRHFGRQLPFLCLSGRQTEEIELTFAEGLPLPKPLAARKVATSVFSYASSWRLQDRTLTIRREFVAHVPSQVCAPERESEIAKAMQGVIADLKAAISFDFTAPSAQDREQARAARQAAAEHGQVN